MPRPTHKKSKLGMGTIICPHCGATVRATVEIEVGLKMLNVKEGNTIILPAMGDIFGEKQTEEDIKK